MELHEKDKQRVEMISNAQLAEQVSHDIRSPLSALNIAIKTERNISEDRKKVLDTAIKRISLIADDLMKKSRAVLKTHHHLLVEQGKLILPLVLEIMDEKKIEISERKEICLSFTHIGVVIPIFEASV